MTPWQKAYKAASSQPGFLNLVDTNFHRAGWKHPAELLGPLWQEYLESREYSPDPRGLEAARTAAASLYASLPKPPAPEDFFLTASTSEAYSLLFSLLCRPGEKILVPRPGYPLFEHLAGLAKVEVGHYDLREPAWELTAQALEEGWRPGTRVLVVISPHNPTGRVFSPEELSAALDFCRRKNLALIWDEVFDPWVFPPLDQLPRPWEAEPSVPVFFLNGISKRFASADLKLGWILCRLPAGVRTELYDRLEMANDSLLSCGSFPQFLLPRLFRDSGALTDRMYREAEENRRRFASVFRLSEESLPQGGLHGVLNLPESPWDDEELSIKLLKKGLGLHPGYFYDLSGCRLVLSFVHPPQVFASGMERLAQELKTLV